MLGYLQNISRPNISMDVHQCSRLNNCLKLCHERAIMRTGRCMLGTKDKGVIYFPNLIKGLECNVDANCSGSLKPGPGKTPLECVLDKQTYV